MRIADVLGNGDDDFSGDSIADPALQEGRRQGNRKISKIFECVSPRSVLSRWFSCSKRQRNLVARIEKLERETRREELDAEICRERKEEGCSMIGVNGESSSRVPKGLRESEIANTSEQCGKDCFNLGVGFGLFYLIVASRNELNKMIGLRTQIEMLLENVKEELQNQSGDIFSKRSESDYIPASSTNQGDSKTILSCDQPLTCEAARQDKRADGIDQLEAELEAELEHLQLHLDAEDILEIPKEQRIEMTVEDSAPISSFNASLGEIVDPPGADSREKHLGVPPKELERRLHELLESRQQERIKELEAALECANQMLCERETEACWWKHAAQQFPNTSRLSR